MASACAVTSADASAFGRQADKMDTENSMGVENLPELRPDAPSFIPQPQVNQDIKLPPRVKTVTRKGDKTEKNPLYKVFDAVPFTPSQGVRTPSPNNMATLRWRLYSPFAAGHHPDSPMCKRKPSQYNSPLRPKSTASRHGGAGSDSSSFSESSAGTMMMSPMHPAHSMPAYSPFMMYPVGPIPGYITQEMPCSPHAGRSPLIPGSPVATPTAMMFPQTPFAPSPGSPFAAFPHPSPFGTACMPPFPGDPACMQPQPYKFFNAPHPGFAPNYQFIPSPAFQPVPMPIDVHVNSIPPEAIMPSMTPLRRQLSTPVQPTSGSPAVPTLAPQTSLQPQVAGGRGLRVSQSADLNELASKSGSQQRPRFKSRKNSEPKIGPDGMPRLNARQRRTLRRAKERALKGLLEVSQALLQKAGSETPTLSINIPSTADTNSDSQDGSMSPSSSVSSESPCLSRTASQSLSVSRLRSSPSSPIPDVEDDGRTEPLDVSGIADLIQQLSLKKEEGLVDEKLLRDLQIIQSLIGALQAPLPSSQNGKLNPAVIQGHSLHRAALEREVGRVKKAFGFGVSVPSQA